MSDPSDVPSSPERELATPEQRARLLKKLNCLIAVLEVACAKVRRSLGGPDADLERLTRIHKNLRDTLEVCLRARRAIERREALPGDLPAALADVGSAGGSDNGRSDSAWRGRGEFSSAREAARFQRLGPIGAEEIARVDLDLLAGLLQARPS
jgi:hypothetical protein